MPRRSRGRQPREGPGRNPLAKASEKSDALIVPKKPGNLRVTPRDSAEGRSAANGKSAQRNVRRTQRRTSTPTYLERIGNKAKQKRRMKFTNLLCHVKVPLLKKAYEGHVLEPHIEATIGRVRTAGTCLVVHDTTDVTVGGSSEREGMGVTSPAGQGFFAHIALAVLPGEERLPLGVLGLRRHVRPKGRARKTKRALAKDPQRESLRWVEMLEQVHSEVGSDVINVMDREADIFGVLAKAQELLARYIIRAAQNRSTDEVGVYLRDAISELEPQLHRGTPACCAGPGWGRWVVVRNRAGDGRLADW